MVRHIMITSILIVITLLITIHRINCFDINNSGFNEDLNGLMDSTANSDESWGTGDELIYVERRANYRSSSGKRQSHPETQYVCKPSRDDVIRLLFALNDAKEGNSARTVNFCHLRRPASTVLTNLRFMGRKRR